MDFAQLTLARSQRGRKAKTGSWATVKIPAADKSYSPYISLTEDTGVREDTVKYMPFFGVINGELQIALAEVPADTVGALRASSNGSTFKVSTSALNTLLEDLEPGRSYEIEVSWETNGADLPVNGSLQHFDRVLSGSVTI